VPGTVQADRLRFAEPGDPILAEQQVEFLPENAIHIAPGKPTCTDCFHAGAVATFPVIDKGLPIHGDPSLPSKNLKLFDDTGAPIDDCTEDIEDQGFHRHVISL
jgi:hypothetical protein